MDESDASFISEPTAKDYFDTVNSENGYDANNLQQQFSFSNEEVVKVLCDLLQFNPHKRVSAADCLQNKIFDPIRVPELEQPAPFKIKLNVDDYDAFDYDANEDMVYRSEQEYRDQILKACSKVWRTKQQH